MSTDAQTPETADDMLLEMSDFELMSAIGSDAVTSRADATFPLLKAVSCRFGDMPSEPALDRVVDTLVETGQLTIAA